MYLKEAELNPLMRCEARSGVEYACQTCLLELWGVARGPTDADQSARSVPGML